MENSILKSVKKIVGVPDNYDVFDLDIITHINSAFSVLYQIGAGPIEGFFIEDESAKWDDFSEDPALNLVRSYVFLKVRMLFDPPITSFLQDAMKKQMDEMEWRISIHREWNLNPIDPMEEVLISDDR